MSDRINNPHQRFDHPALPEALRRLLRVPHGVSQYGQVRREHGDEQRNEEERRPESSESGWTGEVRRWRWRRRREGEVLGEEREEGGWAGS